jgi:hypothetical protein
MFALSSGERLGIRGGTRPGIDGKRTCSGDPLETGLDGLDRPGASGAGGGTELPDGAGDEEDLSSLTRDLESRIARKPLFLRLRSG